MYKKFIFPFIVFLLICPRISLAKAEFPFEGHVNLSDEEYKFKLNLDGDSFLSTSVSKESKDQYKFTIIIDHLKYLLVDLSTQLEGVLKFEELGDDNWSVIGEVWSQYSLINYQPVRELSGNFLLKNQKLIVRSFSFGNVAGRGTVDLIPPYKVDIDVDLLNVSMKNFLSFWTGGTEIDSSGQVSGQIQITGSLPHPLVRGQLSSYEGHVQQLDFDNIAIKFEGDFPVIQLRDSRVSTSDGLVFSVDGALNIADKENMVKQIKALSKSPLINVEGENVEWTLKRIESDDDTGRTEFKYLRPKRDRLKQSKEEMDMLGVERSIQF